MSLFSVTFESSGDEGAMDLEESPEPPAEIKPVETVLTTLNENKPKPPPRKLTKSIATHVQGPYLKKSRKVQQSSIISRKKPQVKQQIQFSTSSDSSSDEIEFIGKANGLNDIDSDEEIPTPKPVPELVDAGEPSEPHDPTPESHSNEEDHETTNKAEEENTNQTEEKCDEEECHNEQNTQETKCEEEKPEPEQPPQLSEDEESVHIDVSDSSEDAGEVSANQQFFELPDSVVFRGVRNPKVAEEMNAKLERLPNHKKPTNMIPYKMVKKWSLSLKGKVTQLILYQNDRPILQTKMKIGKSTDSLLVSQCGEDLEFKGEKYECAILTGNNFTTYSLRIGTQFGPEIMNIKYEQAMVACAPRVVTVFFRTAPEGVDRELVSKKPKMTSADTWMMDLKGRIGVRSNRNCVLIDSKKREVMSVMKTRSSLKEEVITIETVPSMSELCVFALGASSFLCNL